MTIPSRVEAASLLLSLDPPAWHLRHSRAVAEVAGWLARRAAARGIRVDRALVEAAALLHDADKLLPPGDPAGRLPHGDGSGAWLRRRGHPELEEAAAAHPVTRLADAAWAETASTEATLVAYADKRAGQRLESMAARFAGWAARYPDGWDPAQAELARQRGADLEIRACALAGVSPGDVRRLRWTGSALEAAIPRAEAVA